MNVAVPYRYGAFEALPDELVKTIFGMLSAQDLTRVGFVCRYFNDMASDDSLWFKLCELQWTSIPRDYPKQGYRNYFVTRMRRERQPLQPIRYVSAVHGNSMMLIIPRKQLRNDCSILLHLCFPC